MTNSSIPAWCERLPAVPSLSSQTTGEEPVTVTEFGRTQEGERVDLFTLTNNNGMSVTLSSYGAAVINLVVPDRSGNLEDVTLGFDTFSPCETESPYFGAIVGRYGNRIAMGSFLLDGKTYTLATNSGPNHLHGGNRGFDKRIWKGSIPSFGTPCVCFKRVAVDGEEGYPGMLEVAVTYLLTARNELRISYEATTDRPTIVNLTNHTYFNLAGAGNGDILGHHLRIQASRYTPVDADLIPTGELRSVEGSALDFRRAKAIGARIMEVGGKPAGYDLNYVLNRLPLLGLTLAAEVSEPKSGRCMRVYTDQPGVQFYSGNFLDGTITGKGGARYRQFSGFCLETQHFPDSPNRPQFPTTVLRPGESYKSRTVYAFSVK